MRLAALRIVVVAITLAGLLALVGLASRTHVFGQGTPVPAPVTRVTADSFFYLAIALVVVMLLIQLWALWPDPNGQIMEPPRKRTIWDIIVPPISLVILLAALYSIRTRLGAITGGRGAGLSAATASSLRLNPGQSATPYLQGVDWIALGIVIVTLGIAGGWIAYLLRPIARRPHRRLPLAEELSELLDETIDELVDEPDPRQAVILAYARMERVLGRSGLPRRPPEAPLEYMERVLNQLVAAGEPVRRLTDLFEWARFSQHPIDAGMRADAIAALVAIRDELGRQAEAVGARSHA